MKNFIVAIVLLSFIVLIACKGEKTSKQETTNFSTEVLDGIKLLETQCYVCHSPTASEKARLAPPMIAVKKHYIEEVNATEEQFLTDLKDFLLDPTNEKSKMPGAVKRFGVMMKINLSDEQIEKIGKAIYRTELPQPDWFEEHYKNRNQDQTSQPKTDLEIGQDIALSTKALLGKNLMNAIQTKGTIGALDFCSEKAIPLTDSMSIVHNATVKRVSDKNRNPDNAANADELTYIEYAKNQLAKNQEIAPKLLVAHGKNVGYYPILSNKMCLQCHGKKEIEINSNVLEAIHKNYPEDKATGYRENELRGIWVIEFDPQRKS